MLNPDAASYASVGFGGTQEPPADFVRSAIPEDLDPIIRETVRGELLDRLGYTSDEDAADLLLYVGVGRRVDVETGTITQLPTRANNIHPNYEGAFEERIERGTLVFDAFDRATGLHVWHGQIASVIHGDVDPDRLKELLVELFASFPAASSTPQ